MADVHGVELTRDRRCFGRNLLSGALVFGAPGGPGWLELVTRADDKLLMAKAAGRGTRPGRVVSQ